MSNNAHKLYKAFGDVGLRQGFPATFEQASREARFAPSPAGVAEALAAFAELKEMKR